MRFIESYKTLEQLCRDVMNDRRSITAYIEEMENNSNGPFHVNTWNADLKMLKHCRWIRNRISHEPGCSEENMCLGEESLWLGDFYCRLLNQTDPLSLFRKAVVTQKQRITQLAKMEQTPTTSPKDDTLNTPFEKPMGQKTKSPPDNKGKRFYRWVGKPVVVFLLAAIFYFLFFIIREILQNIAYLSQ